MANILNYRAIFSQIWKQKKAEAETFGSRSVKLQSIDGLFESKKFEKVKWSNIVNCVQKKYFSYIIDKIVSLRRSFSKALVTLAYCFCYFLINSLYQPCISSWRFWKWAVSLLYRINIWTFGIFMVNLKQIVWEPMKYYIIFLIYVTCVK